MSRRSASIGAEDSAPSVQNRKKPNSKYDRGVGPDCPDALNRLNGVAAFIPQRHMWAHVPVDSCLTYPQQSPSLSTPVPLPLSLTALSSHQSIPSCPICTLLPRKCQSLSCHSAGVCMLKGPQESFGILRVTLSNVEVSSWLIYVLANIFF